MKNENYERVNPYQAVTTRIVMSLAKNDIPWRKPWASPYNNDIINYDSRKPYRGINRILLGRKGEWLTFTQAKAAGGAPRKGVKGTPRLMFNEYVPADKKQEYDDLVAQGLPADHLKQVYAKLGYVFHIEDCDGVESKNRNVEHKEAEAPTDIADAVIQKFGFKVKADDSADSVKVAGITVTLPEKSRFRTEEEWYNSVFVAMAQATATKCNRAMPGEKGYSDVKEGLVVEMAASMVLAAVGLERKEANENTTAKCAEWIEAFNKDLRLVVGAASAAEKAAKVILEPLFGEIAA